MGADDDGDDIPVDDIVGMTNVDEITEYLEIMVVAANESGFPRNMRKAQREVTLHEVDLRRIKLGADPPVKLEPLRVVLVENAVPFLTKSRQYSTLKKEIPR
ncbi:hypothetical protein CCR75_004285 [Bremia lactucae]|uniref:Uncharacterized protein n=1 Tax=Bremia lactucae TaxID=4779 RepID=A0A976II32_BRELC|nr:hypothetical protein CCR75_004285 [Bremia lactucae]